MISTRSRFFALAAAMALGLSACGGGVGGGGVQSLPAGDNVLPSEVPAGSTLGIEDYLVPGFGTWQIDIDGQVEAIGYGDTTMADALIYDPDSDQWTINVAGTNFLLTNDGFDVYESSCSAGATSCALFLPYDDDPLASQYGTFGYVLYVDTARLVEYFTYYGLKTASADMPTSGTATYSGTDTFLGLVNYTDADFPETLFADYVTGSADLTVTFTAGGGTVDFASAGSGFGTYELTGTATISGNTYDGTVTGWYDDGITPNVPSLQLDATGTGSTLSGAFYGPDQTLVTDVGETAGAVYATSAAGDPNWGEFAGGFWAPQTTYVP